MKNENTDNVYELAEQVVKIAEDEAKKNAHSHDFYAYLSGQLEANLKWIPQTRENAKYLRAIINRS